MVAGKRVKNGLLIMRKSMHNSITIEKIQIILRDSICSTPGAASCFFKTGVGEYAEFDRFLGIKTPTLRQIAKKYMDLPLQVIEELLQSKFNEERLFALIILVSQYQKADALTQENIYQFYLKNMQHVNNWNLVDNSAHHILGPHLKNRDRKVLLRLAKSQNLWERRISIVATWYFIKQLDFEYTTKITEILLHDKHDLSHKACGWMLREIGKQNEKVLIDFLELYCALMPRTMLRYAIEKFPEDIRRNYLLK